VNEREHCSTVSGTIGAASTVGSRAPVAGFLGRISSSTAAASSVWNVAATILALEGESARPAAQASTWARRIVPSGHPPKCGRT
jgi:hypothetical protein